MACHMACPVPYCTVRTNVPFHSTLNVLQSVRSELIDKEERDTTGLDSLLEGDQESYFLSAPGDKSCGKQGWPFTNFDIDPLPILIGPAMLVQF